MFLSRLDINPHRRSARELLASPQRMHAAVMAAFPEDRPDNGRVLWRLDDGRHDVRLYLVSPEKPDLHHVVEQAGRPEYGWQTREYGPFLGRIETGGVWAFRLTANPVHNVRPDDGGRGKRYAHVTVAQQAGWLLDEHRAQACGFSVPDSAGGGPDLVVRSRRTLRFARGARTVTLGTATFEGTLRVEDPDALRAALTSGIGPAKGYGCGLMTLAAP